MEKEELLKQSNTSINNKHRLDPHERDETEIEEINPLSQILPWLYIGNVYQAHDNELLQRYSIKCILNVCGGRYPDDFSEQTFCIHPLSDYGTDDLSRKLLPCFQFLQRVKEREDNVLVHFQMGSNRAPTVVIAYLMNSERWNLKKAYEHVKSCRPIISPHEEYFKQLLKFELELFGSNSMTLNEFPSLNIRFVVS